MTSSDLSPSTRVCNHDALTYREEDHVKIARSMTDSTLRNLLQGVGINDLDSFQLRRLAGVCIVAARRRDPAPAVDQEHASGGDHG